MKYRKRPLVIEAELFTADNGAELAQWCGGRFSPLDELVLSAPFLTIPTLEGEMTAFPGDWIIHGVIGEFYPVKAAVFEATYEPVTD